MANYFDPRERQWQRQVTSNTAFEAGKATGQSALQGQAGFEVGSGMSAQPVIDAGGRVRPEDWYRMGPAMRAKYADKAPDPRDIDFAQRQGLIPRDETAPAPAAPAAQPKAAAPAPGVTAQLPGPIAAPAQPGEAGPVIAPPPPKQFDTPETRGNIEYMGRDGQMHTIDNTLANKDVPGVIERNRAGYAPEVWNNPPPVYRGFEPQANPQVAGSPAASNPPINPANYSSGNFPRTPTQPQPAPSINPANYSSGNRPRTPQEQTPASQTQPKQTMPAPTAAYGGPYGVIAAVGKRPQQLQPAPSINPADATSGNFRRDVRPPEVYYNESTGEVVRNVPERPITSRQQVEIPEYPITDAQEVKRPPEQPSFMDRARNLARRIMFQPQPNSALTSVQRPAGDFTGIVPAVTTPSGNVVPPAATVDPRRAAPPPSRSRGFQPPLPTGWTRSESGRPIPPGIRR